MLDILLITHNRESLLIAFGVTDVVQLKTGQDGKGLLRIHLWCPDDLPRLWDRIDRKDVVQAQNLTLVDRSAQWILTRIITEVEVQQLNLKWISQSSVVFI